jgi:hypothetical protein
LLIMIDCEWLRKLDRWNDVIENKKMRWLSCCWEGSVAGGTSFGDAAGAFPVFTIPRHVTQLTVGQLNVGSRIDNGRVVWSAVNHLFPRFMCFEDFLTLPPLNIDQSINFIFSQFFLHFYLLIPTIN